jgi:hypothetical protein
VTTPLAVTTLQYAAITAGSAAAAAECHKRAQSAAYCQTVGIRFLHLAVETFCGWGADALRFIQTVARRVTDRTGQPRNSCSASLFQDRSKKPENGDSSYKTVTNYQKQGKKLLLTGVIPRIIVLVILITMFCCLGYFLLRRKQVYAESLIMAACAIFTFLTSIAVVVLHTFHPDCPLFEALSLRIKADEVTWLHQGDKYYDKFHSFGLKEQDYFGEDGKSFMEDAKRGKTCFQNGVSIKILNGLGYKVCITQAGTIALLNPDKTTGRHLEKSMVPRYCAVPL